MTIISAGSTRALQIRIHGIRPELPVTAIIRVENPLAIVSPMLESYDASITWSSDGTGHVVRNLTGDEFPAVHDGYKMQAVVTTPSGIHKSQIFDVEVVPADQPGLGDGYLTSVVVRPTLDDKSKKAPKPRPQRKKIKQVNVESLRETISKRQANALRAKILRGNKLFTPPSSR